MSIQILEKDLVVERIKGSGPGGQHRNKRDTGIRLTHLPTGISVVAFEERSQSRNLEQAMRRLREKLEKYFYKPKSRKKTVAPKWVKTRKFADKRIRSEKKKLRKSVKSYD